MGDSTFLQLSPQPFATVHETFVGDQKRTREIKSTR